MSNIFKNNNRNIVIGVILMSVLLFLAAIIVLNGHDSISRLIHSSTSHQPEKVTELYFADYGSIPKKLEVGDKTDISFKVVNHESARTGYSYKVILDNSSGSQEISSGNFTLNNEESTLQKFTFSPSTQNTTNKISVILLNKNQIITVRIES